MPTSPLSPPLRPAAALLLGWLLAACLPAWGAGWTRQDNRALLEGPRPGWSLEVPSDWIAIPDLHPPPPEGLGFRSPGGEAGVTVVWRPSLPEGEIAALAARGYEAGARQLAGAQARVHRQLGSGRLRQEVYLDTPQGVYRITLFGEPGQEPILSRIVDSFSWLRALPAVGPSPWQTWVDPEGQVRIPHPPDWAVEPGDQGGTIGPPSAPPALSWSVWREPTAGRSFRGFARSLGPRTLPGATTLERFEPVQTEEGRTGYLAVWRDAQGALLGPVIYLPLDPGPELQALILRQLDPGQGERFHQVARRVRLGSGR